MVPDEVWENILPNPKTTALEREREHLKGSRYQIGGQEYEEEVQSLAYQISLFEAKQRKDGRPRRVSQGTTLKKL